MKKILFMRLDTKSIFLITFFFLALFFCFKWYNSEESNYKKELERLHSENELLQKTRDSLSESRMILEGELLDITRNSLVMKEKIKLLEQEVQSNKKNAEKSKQELNRLRKSIDENRKKLQHVKDNPPNRTGDDLLNSLKIKIK
jgi:chromosome segregation ATPase